MSNENPIPCACGGFWPDDHIAGCTHKEMAKLWPKSYRKELSARAGAYRPTADEVERSERQGDQISTFRAEY